LVSVGLINISRVVSTVEKEPNILKGKGQNVENQNVESQKKNIENQKEHKKSERQKSNLSDFQILMKKPMAFWRKKINL
jgi:hypothetical protein